MNKTLTKEAKLAAIENVKNNWTFSPIKIMNGKFGPCITLTDDVVIEFVDPSTGETVRAELKKELNEDYTGPVFSHSKAATGKRRNYRKDPDTLLSVQVRFHNSTLQK